MAQRGIDRNAHRAIDTKLAEEAFRANEYAAKLDPKLKTEALANAAFYSRWLGQFVKEASYWEQVVNSDPTNLKFRESLAMAYWNAGVEARKPKYYQLAISEFRNILSVKRDYPKAQEYITKIERDFLSPSVGMQ